MARRSRLERPARRSAPKQRRNGGLFDQHAHESQLPEPRGLVAITRGCAEGAPGYGQETSAGTYSIVCT